MEPLQLRSYSLLNYTFMWGVCYACASFDPATLNKKDNFNNFLKNPRNGQSLMVLLPIMFSFQIPTSTDFTVVKRRNYVFINLIIFLRYCKSEMRFGNSYCHWRIVIFLT